MTSSGKLSPEINRHHLTVPDTLTSMLISDTPTYTSQSAVSNSNDPTAPTSTVGLSTGGQLMTTSTTGASAGDKSHLARYTQAQQMSNRHQSVPQSLPTPSIPMKVSMRMTPHKYFLLGCMKVLNFELLSARLRGITDCSIEFHEYVREMVAGEQRLQIRVDLRPDITHPIYHCHIGPVENDTTTVHRCVYHNVPADISVYPSLNKKQALNVSLYQSTQFYHDIGFSHSHDYVQEGHQFCRFIAVPYRQERLPIFARIFTLKHVTASSSIMANDQNFDAAVTTAKPFLADMRMVEVFTVTVAFDKEGDFLKSEVASFAEELAPLAKIDKLDDAIFTTPTISSKNH